MKFKTYYMMPSRKYVQIGFFDAQAAADAINKILMDSGEATFPEGDALADATAHRAIQRELDSCAPEMRDDLVVESRMTDVDD